MAGGGANLATTNRGNAVHATVGKRRAPRGRCRAWRVPASLVAFLALVTFPVFGGVSSATIDYNDARVCYFQHACGFPDRPEGPNARAAPQAVHRSDELLHDAPHPSAAAALGSTAAVEQPAVLTTASRQQNRPPSSGRATPAQRAPPSV